MYELLVGGCSGSSAPIHPRSIFGHLTTSFGLLDRKNKRGIVIDNGTGVQVVAKEMLIAGIVETIIVQTHFHSDHLEGLQFNTLLFGRTVEAIVVPRFKDTKRFEQIYAERFDQSAWPVSPETFGIQHSFISFQPSAHHNMKLDNQGWIDTLELNHPGGSIGYRFALPDGQVIVIATDNELNGTDEEYRMDYGNFVSGANILIADVQYTQDEYAGRVSLGGEAMFRKGWGHSTPEMLADTLTRFCDIRPKEIYLTHHDPSRTDDDLYEFLDQIHEVDEDFSLLMPS